VLLSVTKIGGINTLELVDRIRAYIERKNAVLAGSGCAHAADDQTVPTREALGVMQSNALIGLLLVLAVCWLFLGSRIALMVALGVVFSIAGTFILLAGHRFTLNVSVLLGIVIVLGMLVDDAVVVVEAIYYRMQRGEARWTPRRMRCARSGAGAGGGGTTMAAFLPLMLLPGIVGKFMFVIPFVVTWACHQPDRGLLDAARARLTRAGPARSAARASSAARALHALRCGSSTRAR
jgi:multidrug efflux pump subunit AcrB